MADLDFIQVGDLVKGIRQEGMPSVDDLAGKSLELAYEDGGVTRVAFTGPNDLAWEVLQGPEKGRSGKESYSAFRPRDDIYFVDYVSSMQRATSVSMVLDMGSGSATVVVGAMPSEDEVGKGALQLALEGAEMTFVAVEFKRAAIDRPFTAEEHRHVPTAEMVGKRVKYVYSPTETYEHIYLNEKLYTWQCLAGIEKGLADTDRNHAFKLDDRLYLFVWRERVVPTLGVVVVDWRDMRSYGKLFGYEGSDFGAVANAPIASVATLLNVTEYGLDEA
jgi:hypothetical protein